MHKPKKMPHNCPTLNGFPIDPLYSLEWQFADIIINEEKEEEKKIKTKVYPELATIIIGAINGYRVRNYLKIFEESELKKLYKKMEHYFNFDTHIDKNPKIQQQVENELIRSIIRYLKPFYIKTKDIDIDECRIKKEEQENHIRFPPTPTRDGEIYIDDAGVIYQYKNKKWSRI